MKTTMLMALFLVALAGCAAKKQQIMQSTEECIAARDAALRAAASCDQCCASRAPMRK
jgi:hypothetical protein